MNEIEKIECSKCGAMVDINKSYVDTNDGVTYICEECYQDYMDLVFSPNYDE